MKLDPLIPQFDGDQNWREEVVTRLTRIETKVEAMPCRDQSIRLTKLEMNGQYRKGMLGGLALAAGCVGGGVAKALDALLGVLK